MTPEQVKQLQMQLNAKGANLKVDGILGPKTTAAMNNAVSGAIASNPTLAPLVAQNNPEAILNAYQTNDWSGIADITGKPFSDEDQRMAVEKSTAALAPYFEAEKRFEEENFKRSVGDQTRNFEDYVEGAATSFQEDKTQLDQNAADKGVLFSGGRIQKEQNLKTAYERDQASKMGTLGSNISKLGNDFAYRYGDEAVNKPTLSSLYQTKTNTFNPNVARNGVTSNGLSSIYNAGNKGYQGTVVNNNKANIQTRAASLLTNKANKIVPYGYQNKL